MARLFSSQNILSVLLVFVPVALVLEYVMHASDLTVFIASAIAIVPLAGWMGRATEHLAEHVGEGLGGLLNAAFGNAAELIIAVVALRAGLHDLVKASITGSIIGNVLLVFGLAALAGGLRHRTLRFNPTAAAQGATMLVLSGIALLVPASFHAVAPPGAAVGEHRMSLIISVVLMVVYVLSLVFTLRTHAHLYVGAAEPASTAPSHPSPEESEMPAAPDHPAHGEPVVWTRSRSLGILVAAAVLVGIMSELLVASVEEAGRAVGMTEVFVGVILVAIVGNAAEHSTAILVAVKNKMDLSVNIAVGSSLQVALFVAPLLVFVSYFVGPAPMDLLFTTMEVAAVVAAVGIMALISHDGQTHWMEGVQLLAVYVIIGTAFFFLPG